MLRPRRAASTTPASAAWATLALCLALLLTGCSDTGGAEASPSRESASPEASERPTTATPSAPGTGSAAPTPAAPREASCRLAGSGERVATRATLRDTGRALVVRFQGPPPSATQEVGYFAFVADADGQGPVELGVRFARGRQSEAYRASSEVGNRRLPTRAVVRREGITVTYSYRALGPLARRGVGRWNATTTLGGRTTDTCTTPLQFVPFPG